MVDISKQLEPYLIKTELDRLKDTTGHSYRYTGSGQFKRVEDKPVSVRRVPTASAFEPPQDNDPIEIPVVTNPINRRPFKRQHHAVPGDVYHDLESNHSYLFNGEHWMTLNAGDVYHDLRANQDIVVTPDVLAANREEQRNNELRGYTFDVIYGVQTIRPETAVRLSNGHIDASQITAESINESHITTGNNDTLLQEPTWENANLNGDQAKVKKRAEAKIRSNLNEDLKRKIDL